MKKLLKKGHQCIVAQLFSIDVQTSKIPISQDLQRVVNKHSKVFEDIPKGIPPIHEFDHAIHLISGIFPTNIRPYRYPYFQKSEIERMVAKMLEAGIIRPNQSSYSAPVVMVPKTNGSWHMCLLDELVDESTRLVL